MPIYELGCKCGNTLEIIQQIGDASPACSVCGGGMVKMPTAPAMVKMTGEYRTPAERKWGGGTAPFTKGKGHPEPWQEGDPNEPIHQKQGRKWRDSGVFEGGTFHRDPEATYGRTKEEVLGSLDLGG